MRGLLISLVLAATLCACAKSGKPSSDYTLYLVRHAEKQSAEKSSNGKKDPALSSVGEARANNLAIWFLDKQIKDIWSSDYQRTRNTAAPLAAELDLVVKIYNPRELQSLVSELHNRQVNALIVGHSDTTPDLARLLCDCSVGDMDESEYDRLLVIHVRSGIATLETLSQ